MGKEHHVRRPSWVPAFLVVVSIFRVYCPFRNISDDLWTCRLYHFLFSPPSVFWDLYCAAPERRDTCEHSSEAKAFHDYVSIGKHGLFPKRMQILKWKCVSFANPGRVELSDKICSIVINGDKCAKHNLKTS